MAYFSNGLEGQAYMEQYCHKCWHYDDCPVMLIHVLYNSEQHTDEKVKAILDMLIPTDGINNLQCSMFDITFDAIEDSTRPLPPISTKRYKLIEK